MKKYYYPFLNIKNNKVDKKKISDEIGIEFIEIAEALIPLLEKGNLSISNIYKKMSDKGIKPEYVFKLFIWLEENSLLKESESSLLNLLEEIDNFKNDEQINFLSIDEKKFYLQQITWLSFINETKPFPNNLFNGLKGQLKLKNSVIGVIGHGISCNNLIQSLARIGIGKIIRVREQNDHNNSKSDLDLEIPKINPFIDFIEVKELENIYNLNESLNHLPDVIIYCSDSFDNELCRKINHMSLRKHIPLFIYKLQIFNIEIGPLIIPYETPCYTCYEIRRKAIDTNGEIRQLSVDALFTPQLNLAIGIDWIIIDIIKFLMKFAEPSIQGKMIDINLKNGELNSHTILKLPRCSSCGKHNIKPPRKLWEHL